MSPALRLVRPNARPSVVVDMSRPVFTCPWTMAEMTKAWNADVPHPLVSAMYVAAWARAEHCPLSVVGGRLDLHTRYEPSDELWIAVARGMGDIVGALGFAIPLLLDEHRRAYAASWPFDFASGRN